MLSSPGKSPILERCDIKNANTADGIGKYLAGADNVLVMSTCIEALFDSGAPVLKVGPPESQFYRVRVARDKARELIDFDADFQLRSLLTRPEKFRGPGAAVAGLLDGLIVDLTRPARANVIQWKNGDQLPMSAIATLSSMHAPTT